MDETLAQHVESLHSKALKGVDELEKKILRAEKRNFADARNKIQEVREALFPLNGLQERVENFIPWYALYGRAFIDLIYENSLTLEAGVCCVGRGNSMSTTSHHYPNANAYTPEATWVIFIPGILGCSH